MNKICRVCLRTKLLAVLAVVLCVVSSGALHADPYWVFFTDRGDIDVGRAVAAKTATAGPKMLSRRARLYGADEIFDERDLMPSPDYITGVESSGGEIRVVSRFLNAVSAELNPTALGRVKILPFVREVRPVVSFRRPVEPESHRADKTAGAESTEDYSYGDSFDQNSMLGIVRMHNAGYLGTGLKIAVLDSGFDGLGHVAFDSLTVEAGRDFIDGDDAPLGDDHGTEVLSVLAALDNGRMIGTTPYATYLLGRTEMVGSSHDFRVEEDYWIAGIEWADSLGADIVNSSLGYTTFGNEGGYTYDDLDGDTAVTTIAADAAAEKGMIIVTSAGNEGNDPWYYITTPADGDSVIAVGSVNRDKYVSMFSSRGPTPDGRTKPDFMALGENVLVTDSGNNNAYKFVQGTSYSAPSVAGAMALILQKNPLWDFGTIREKMIVSATSSGADSLYGYGVPDAYEASGLKAEEPDVASFRVYDPYPQPVMFSSTSRAVYFPMDVPDVAANRTSITIRIFSFNGEMVKEIKGPLTFTGELKTPGMAPSWDGTNFKDEDVAPGVYFYTIRLYGYGTHTGKILVMR